MIKLVKNFTDWMYTISYQQNVVKAGNPVIYVYSYNSFIYNNLFIFLVNVAVGLMKLKTLKPIWFIIIYLIILFINYYYYEIRGKKYKINVKLVKNDNLKHTIILFISSVLCFVSYVYFLRK